MLVVAGIWRIDFAEKKNKTIRVTEGATYIKFNTYFNNLNDAVIFNTKIRFDPHIKVLTQF